MECIAKIENAINLSIEKIIEKAESGKILTINEHQILDRALDLAKWESQKFIMDEKSAKFKSFISKLFAEIIDNNNFNSIL